MIFLSFGFVSKRLGFIFQEKLLLLVTAVEAVQGVYDQILLHKEIQGRLGAETGRVVDFDQHGLKLAGYQNIKPQYLETD